MRTTLTLDSSDAEEIAAACSAAAREAGAAVSIAIVDAAGVLVQFHRLDGARAHSVELAQRKARASALLALPTAILEQMAKEGRLPPGDIIAVGGGVPAICDGQCAGAVGVSGATSEIDDGIAAAGVAALAAQTSSAADGARRSARASNSAQKGA